MVVNMGRTYREKRHFPTDEAAQIVIEIRQTGKRHRLIGRDHDV